MLTNNDSEAVQVQRYWHMSASKASVSDYTVCHARDPLAAGMHGLDVAQVQHFFPCVICITYHALVNWFLQVGKIKEDCYEVGACTTQWKTGIQNTEGLNWLQLMCLHPTYYHMSESLKQSMESGIQEVNPDWSVAFKKDVEVKSKLDSGCNFGLWSMEF